MSWVSNFIEMNRSPSLTVGASLSFFIPASGNKGMVSIPGSRNKLT